MGPFYLLLLTLNPHSGALLGSTVVGAPYPSIEQCVQAAIDKGPMKASGDEARFLVCRASRQDYADSRPSRQGRS